MLTDEQTLQVINESIDRLRAVIREKTAYKLSFKFYGHTQLYKRQVEEIAALDKKLDMMIKARMYLENEIRKDNNK